MSFEGDGGVPCATVAMVSRCTRTSSFTRSRVRPLRSRVGCASMKLLGESALAAEGVCERLDFGVGPEFGARPDVAEPPFPRPREGRVVGGCVRGREVIKNAHLTACAY